MMKGQEIIDSIVRAEMPDLEQVRQKCLAQAATKPRRAMRPLVLAAVTLATAMVLAVYFTLGSTLFSPKAENSFSIKAYALEQQEDGSFSASDTYIDDSGDVVGMSFSGLAYWSYYRAFFLNFEGNNIQSIEFFAYDDEDYAETHPPIECGEIDFAKTNLLMINGKIFLSPPEKIYDNQGNYVGSGRTVYQTTPLQHLGSSFTIDVDDLTEDLVLAVGRKRLRGYVSYNLNITVHAVATFTDGNTQEETFFVP